MGMVKKFYVLPSKPIQDIVLNFCKFFVEECRLRAILLTNLQKQYLLSNLLEMLLYSHISEGSVCFQNSHACVLLLLMVLLSWTTKIPVVLLGRVYLFEYSIFDSTCQNLIRLLGNLLISKKL